MFTADVVPFAMGTGMGYYSVYNLTVLSAEKGTFQDWQPTLNKVLSSLNYTPEFQSFAMSQSNQGAATSQSLSQSASEMSDSIMSSWDICFCAGVSGGINSGFNVLSATVVFGA